MKQRVWDLYQRAICRLQLSLRDQKRWPERETLVEAIRALPEYRAVLDVGLPDEKLGMQEDLFAEFCARDIRDYWVQCQSHACLSQPDLETAYNAVKTVGESEWGYGTADQVYSAYYCYLEQIIGNTLYSEKQVYSREELETMVPPVQSSFFDRDRIMDNYERKIEALKTQAKRDQIQRGE